MKKLVIALSLLVSSSAFSATYFQQCKDPAGNIIVCTMGSSPSTSLLPESNGQSSGMPLPTAIKPNLQAPDIKIQGAYDSEIDNVFVLCSGPRPPKHTKRRSQYDKTCPAGKLP